jgi:DNA-binding transcriptional LysR family regulator
MYDAYTSIDIRLNDEASDEGCDRNTGLRSLLGSPASPQRRNATGGVPATGGTVNLFDLESFVAVVDSGSVMAAALRLHLTQSAVTRRVQNLEEELGVSLLNRQMRPLVPTKAGRSAYALAKPILATVTNLKATLAYNGKPSGEFRFGVVLGLGDLALLDPVAVLRKNFPELQLHAYVQGTKTLLDRLQAKTVDAAALLFPQGTKPPTNLVTEYLGMQSSVIVAAKSRPYSDDLRLQDLSCHSWIVDAEDYGTRRSLEDAFGRQGLALRIAIEADGKEFQLSMAARGLGLAVIPPEVYQTSLWRDEIQVLHVSDFSPAQDVWLAYQRYIGHQEKAVACLRYAVLQYLEKTESAHLSTGKQSSFEGDRGTAFETSPIARSAPPNQPASTARF